LNQVAGLQSFAGSVTALQGASDGLPLRFVIGSPGDYETLEQVTQRIASRARQRGKSAGLNVDLACDKPELAGEIARDKAAQMNVSMEDIGVTLASLLGEGEINRFSIEGRSYKVIAQVERAYRDNVSWLGQYHVRNHDGEMIPLGSLITTRE